MENSEDCSYPTVARIWPLPRFVRPAVSSLIKNSLLPIPKIEPLDPRIFQEIEENKERLGEISNTLTAIEAKIKTLCEELESMEKVSRWHDRGNREPRMKQINLQLAELKTKKDAAKDTYNELMKEAETLISITSSHEILLEKLQKLK
jgi:chromosome segregation ATPase